MKTLICHGDSLTEGPDVETHYTWTSLLENRLNLRVINRGISGDTTAGLLGRFSWDVLRHHPEFVLLMAGTNDLWWDLPTNLIMANLFAMVSQAGHHDIAPMIATPPPLHLAVLREGDMTAPACGYGKCQDRISRLADAVCEAAANLEIPCIDFFHRFQTESGEVRADLYLEDGLHPNKNGHRLMAAEITDCMRGAFFFAG